LGSGKTPKVVLRAGSGIFYDRFNENNILTQERLNGVYQQQYIVASPLFFPTIPPLNSLETSAVSPSVYALNPNLRTPYTVQSGLGLERQLSRSATVSLTYINSHGVHQLLTRNINAPDPANPGDAPPEPSQSNIYQYESAGLYNQNQMVANFNLRGGNRFSFFGFYTLSYVDSDTSGANGFPMNQFDLQEDYGRAAWDVRHRLFLGGNWNLPWYIQVFPFVVLNSSPPFNITVGQDLNGDSIFNDRPAFASALSNPANVVSTKWGNFDTVPVAGETIIPINYGVGFGQFTANLRISKTIGFGKLVKGAYSGGPPGGGGFGRGLAGGLGGGMGGPPGGPNSGMTNHKYNVTFSVSARNIFNNVNYAPPVGNLSSPYFGQATALTGGFFSSNAANRRIDLQVRFAF
jgi:hypothetical protein